MRDLQSAKMLVRQLFDDLDMSCGPGRAEDVNQHLAEDFFWRGMHPFNELDGINEFLNEFWYPLNRSFSNLQRRQHIFLTGENAECRRSTCWVCCTGVFMGLFDEAWLGIPPTRKLALLPFAEFHRVEGGKISETVVFFDILSVIRQAGLTVLPEQTGAAIVPPGPLTQDGLLYDAQPGQVGEKTRLLVQKMISALVNSGLHSPAAELELAWRNNMAWYGPDGIGATYTLLRYEQQHQRSFASGLTDFEYDGNDCLIAEANYGALFSWSGFRMRPTGGFMGMTASPVTAEMRVVDIYRRDGDKLAENWVFIDLLHFLKMQGLDVLERIRQIVDPESV